jgi:hypothetical protein
MFCSRLCILYFLHLCFDSFVHEIRKSQFLGRESEVTKREYKPVKASCNLISFLRIVRSTLCDRRKRLTSHEGTCCVLYSRGAITLIAHTIGWRESKIHLEEKVKEEIDLASYNR